VVLGPFNRVEGDLEVRLDVADGRVRRAEVCAPMYRGFEAMLTGRDPHDALVIVPRICGICSVSQSVAAARALAGLAGVSPPPNGQRALNLMLATENLADHLTHFYLFFMPDFAHPGYADRPWHGEVARRFEAMAGLHARAAVAARQRWFTVLGTLGGKWPHTHSLQPGGSTRAVEPAERIRLLARLREFQGFVEDTLFGAPLDEVNALETPAQLAAWHAADPLRGDLRAFLTIAADLGLHRLGPGPGRLLSHGSYPAADGTPWLAAGLWDTGAAALQPLDLATLTEDATHAWLAGGGTDAAHPWQGRTEPLADKPGAYTWNKAPRLAGRVVETGALARQLVAGHPLLQALVARDGGSTVATRVLGRLLEIARVLPAMVQWLTALQPAEPYCVAAPLPAEGRAAGLAEAARGALGHWVQVAGGRIANYQIVAPTSWNFSPRDAAGTPGALEAALEGVPVDGAMPLAVQHVVRSFDPCMVCTVH